MSSSIWTQCGANSNVRPLAGQAFRVVEAQHLVATRKLVDTDEEHAALEELIESKKPRLAPDLEKRGLHYLLSMPFRYPPLPHGSRFGPRFEPGIWYGSASERTALAEAAYYRLLFLAGTDAAIEPIEVDLSCFKVNVKSARGADLTNRRFARYAAHIRSKTRYHATQALGSAMRASGVELFRYPSARDPEGGFNWGVFTGRAFASRRPSPPRTWHMVATRQAVDVMTKDFFRRQSMRFPRSVFEVGGTLPSPAL